MTSQLSDSNRSRAFSLCDIDFRSQLCSLNTLLDGNDAHPDHVNTIKMISRTRRTATELYPTWSGKLRRRDGMNCNGSDAMRAAFSGSLPLQRPQDGQKKESLEQDGHCFNPQLRGETWPSSAQYIYRPISNANQIRLLTLLPGIKGSIIQCELQDVTLLGEWPSYSAISYVWGDPKITCVIRIHDKELQVTTNLESALQNLRLHDASRNLWVDAICIDQYNLAERNEQIQMMTQIYQNATSVLIWLGDYDSATHQGFDILEEIYKDCPPGAEPLLTSTDQPESGENTCDPNVIRAVKKLTTEDYIHLKRAFKDNSWWSRAWVIQEVVLARKLEIICGMRSLSWDALMVVSGQLAQAGTATIALGATVSHLLLIHIYKYVYSNPRMKRSLEWILSIFRKKYCTDPRDNIYAFLGLSTTKGIRPDYKKAVSSVFLESTVVMIQESMRLDVICISTSPELRPVLRFSPNSGDIIPSWVPDWSLHSSFESLVRIGWGEKQLFKASLNTKISSCTFISEKPWLMKLRGGVFDRVTQIFPKIFTASTDWKARVLAWLPEVLCRSGYPTREEILDVVWKVFLRDTQRSPITYFGNGRIFKDEERSYRELFDTWREQAIDSINPMEAELGLNLSRNELNSEVPNAEEFGRVLAASVNGCALFSTEKGYIGLTLASAQAGDRVCVVHGAPVPLLLRNEGILFRGEHAPLAMAGWNALVGSAYVHGIMDGEVMEALEKGEVKEEDIFLI